MIYKERRKKNMNENDSFLGYVQNGQFKILTPEGTLSGSIRLTEIQMQEAVSPESRELDLTEYEKSAIMVRGHESGGWIYSAEVIDRGGPILTAMVMEVFGKEY
jgi:hypothetical protein